MLFWELLDVLLTWVHLAIVWFIFWGYVYWLKNRPLTLSFYVHRIVVTITLGGHAVYGLCPLTVVHWHFRMWYNPSCHWDGKGCIQEVFHQCGLDLPVWPIQLSFLIMGSMYIIDIILRVIDSRKQTVLQDGK